MKSIYTALLVVCIFLLNVGESEEYDAPIPPGRKATSKRRMFKQVRFFSFIQVRLPGLEGIGEIA